MSPDLAGKPFRFTDIDTPMDAAEIARRTERPGEPYLDVDGPVPGHVTRTHWANGNTRILTPEAYARINPPIGD